MGAVASSRGVRVFMYSILLADGSPPGASEMIRMCWQRPRRDQGVVMVSAAVTYPALALLQYRLGPLFLFAFLNSRDSVSAHPCWRSGTPECTVTMLTEVPRNRRSRIIEEVPDDVACAIAMLAQQRTVQSFRCHSSPRHAYRASIQVTLGESRFLERNDGKA
jgi:hypothetical protein